MEVILALLTILTVSIGIWVLSMRRVVPTDQVHILQRGNSTLSYGKGQENGNVYYDFPEWLPKYGVSVKGLPTSVFEIELGEYDAYDLDKVPFLLDIQAFFRIEDANVAANRIDNFNTLYAQLKVILGGASRQILANERLEEIMAKRSEYGEQFTQSVVTELKEWGVVPVKNIELLDIRDSKGSNVIENIMAKKKSEIEKESRITVANNLRLAREAEIEAKQEIDLKTEVANQAVGMKKATVAQEVGIAEQQTAQKISEAEKTSKEKAMEVVKVTAVKQAEIDKQAAGIRAQQDKEVAVIKAGALKEQTQIAAEADKFKIETLAAANLTGQTKDAEGIKAVGEANAEAKKQMELASVTAQTTLAKEIGANKEYQQYLITIEEIKANQAVGIEQAKNLGKAEIKVIANAGDVNAGVTKAMDLFSSKGGTAVGSMLESLSNTEAGKKLIDKFVTPKTEE